MQRPWEELKKLPVPYGHLSPEGRFLRVNPAMCELFGYSEEVLLTLTARDITHPEDREQSVALVERAVRHREEIHQVIKRYLHQKGHILWCLLSTKLGRDENGDPTFFVSRVENVTGRVDEDEVLRAFVRRLQMVKEQERQGIARELHEEVGQVFAGLKLELDRLQSMLSGEAGTTARRLSMVLNDTLASVRTFTSHLRPPILDDLGLESALEWLLVRFCGGAGLQWSFPRSARPLPLDWETRIALFRIAQEGISHIIRHAEASRVDVTLTIDEDWVTMTITDDGVGPPSDDLESGLKVYMLRERATVLGGEVAVRAHRPHGTRIEVKMQAPIQPRQEVKEYWR